MRFFISDGPGLYAAGRRQRDVGFISADDLSSIALARDIDGRRLCSVRLTFERASALRCLCAHFCHDIVGRQATPMLCDGLRARSAPKARIANGRSVAAGAFIINDA